VISIGDRGNVKHFKRAADGSDPSPVAYFTAWATDNKAVYYITTNPNDSRNFLWQQSLDKETPHLLGELGGEEVSSFAITPDGASVAFIRGKWIHDAVMITGLK
jgi:hypothetical protein